MEKSVEKQSKHTYIQQIFSEANLQDCFYSYEHGIQPCVYFFKELADQSHAPVCNIPDTLIINDKESPLIYVYTDFDFRGLSETMVSSGFESKTRNKFNLTDKSITSSITPKVCKSYGSNLKDFVYKITANSSGPQDITGTLKRATYGQHFITGNDVKLFNTDFLQNCSMHQIQKKESVVCLQKFIKSSGPKAFICRTVWKRDSHGCSFIITSKKKFTEQKQAQNKRYIAKISKNFSEIVKTLQGKHLSDTSFYLKNIAEYFKTYRGKVMTEIVGDFIKDINGIWWLVNVKAFAIDQKLSINRFTPKLVENETNVKGEDSQKQAQQKKKYQKTKICRYCQKNYLEPQLKFRITIKMLIETDRYLLHLGKNYKWLQRSDINNVDSHCLYQQHKICQRCYRLYIQIQQLMEVQNNLAARMGIDTGKSPKQLIQCSADTHELQLQSKNKQIEHLKDESIPQTIQLGPNSNIIIKENIPMKNDQIINKMIRYRLILYFKEFDEISEIKPGYAYFLEYSILGIKHKVKLDSNLYIEKQRGLPIRKMKSLYFFANSHEHLAQFTNKNQFLTINLITQNRVKGQRKVFGKLNLSLKQYFSIKRCRKDFYKMFYVDNVTYGWGLQGSVGVIPSKQFVNTSRVVLTTQDKLIYIPNENYYFCECLPEDWLDRLKLKPNQQQKLQQIFKCSFSFSLTKENSNGSRVDISGNEGYLVRGLTSSSVSSITPTNRNSNIIDKQRRNRLNQGRSNQHQITQEHNKLVYNKTNFQTSDIKESFAKTEEDTLKDSRVLNELLKSQIFAYQKRKPKRKLDLSHVCTNARLHA